MQGGSEGQAGVGHCVPSRPTTLTFPSTAPVGPADVTLVTQFSVSRLSRFERMLQAWDGPMSIAIYLVDEEDIRTLESHLSSPSLSPRWQRVALTIVKPDYSRTEEALIERLRYPINQLRNLALALAPAPYTVVVDVDFVPSPTMHSILSSRAVPLINRPSSRNSRSPTLRRTAIVIPTFALASSFTGTFPTTVDDLESLYSAVPQLASLTDANAGHGPTSPSRLFSSPAQSSSQSAIDPAWSYEVCYEPQWEPYYLLHRASHPLYDERFTDQGGDKQSHTLLLNALGYEFRVLRDVWVVHPPKTDRLEEEWPAARLIQRAGNANVEAANKDADSHFNLVAQRDQSRFRYFQDFLPEMENAWGGNVRYPRGCAARVVAGGWGFGKARARTAFGL
ncbi:beta-1,3-N-acetylglucosaminyltransferase, glycosyltransferase family 49 protein [Rhodotorula toruloides]|uniref:Beta-1,3-N-acetylglucosaminyltransferase, glycosyltransferase family 49 protein n=1 Tax=Rhodotorula toruloides TaxID=5286 RepID=A0A511KFT2_RHOTO|nr:beta-1,3-N-acetylglucosaminyltransferase, glycosyltransferase family 49 protein [Rhodotorula toruloides]